MEGGPGKAQKLGGAGTVYLRDTDDLTDTLLVAGASPNGAETPLQVRAEAWRVFLSFPCLLKCRARTKLQQRQVGE